MAKTYKKRSMRKVKSVAHRRAHTKRSSKRTTKKMVDHVHPLAKSEKINKLMMIPVDPLKVVLGKNHI